MRENFERSNMGLKRREIIEEENKSLAKNQQRFMMDAYGINNL